MIKLMFVEDDPDQLMVYEFKFSREGILMIPAKDRDEVFEHIVDKPDIILLDVLLREDNGLDILEKLKQDDRYAHIPVIVFSNFDKQEARDRAESLGAIDYIIKSQTDPIEMTKKIKDFIETGVYTKGLAMNDAM